ncbi:hypothetical protein F971_02690 [Acinetobacter vivianii]|uniref:Uncharacterized protein n=1 Tax=Acinetobacter vivianii TaxID=1776742 RepID=N8W463_9GAMM|nr:hypothetical protein [Acinetobacter vivianii]ENU91598.1 hypothetical protein F971_02690 [Acinetobacter vivianii]
MDILEWIKIFFSGISTILLPVFLWWLNRNSNENSKPKLHSDIDLDLKSAKEFESIKDDPSLSRLIKDRFSKKLFNSPNINFDESVFFTGFKDADRLISKYLIYKDRIRLKYDSMGRVSHLEPKASKFQRVCFFISYIFFVSLAVTPFIFFGAYKDYISHYYHAQNLVIAGEFIISPFLFFIIGIFSLIEGGKQSSAIRFIESIENEEIKIDDTDKNHDNSI